MSDVKDDQLREDLTEEPSQQRIEEFRKKGIVGQSKELVTFFVFTAIVVSFYVTVPYGGNLLLNWMKEIFSFNFSINEKFLLVDVIKIHLTKLVKVFISFMFPISFCGLVFAFFGSFLQIGFVFTLEPLKPDWKKINPFNGFNRIFSLKSIIELGKIVLKISIILFISYFLLKNNFFNSSYLFFLSPSSFFIFLLKILKNFFIPVFIVFASFSGLDYFLQKKEYQKRLMLTKQEAKQEQKEREGNPQIKSRIRSIQREMARRRMMQAVKKAQVVITNPNHIAVALAYDRMKMRAPKVVAKGADYLAEKIKEKAHQSGVPVVENVPLARLLFRTVKLGQWVPRELYQAVAEVLAYVFKLKGVGGWKEP